MVIGRAVFPRSNGRMRAIVNTPAGPTIREVADPEPSADEALVAVRAFSVNRGELALLEARTDDWRPGQDVAGVVVRAAPDGSGPAAGARVAALVEGGGWAELAAIPTTRLAELPDEVGVDQAAALPLAGLTALRTLRLGGALLGERVLVTGAGGGVGSLQAQLAVAAGAEVTAVAGQAHHGQLLEWGVARAVTHPDGADGEQRLVVDWVGGASLAAAIAKVAPGGTVVLGSGNPEKTSLNIYDFLGHEGARVIAYLSYAYPELPARDLSLLVRLVAQRRLAPRIAMLTGWDELVEVIDAMAHRRLAGKAVLTVS